MKDPFNIEEGGAILSGCLLSFLILLLLLPTSSFAGNSSKLTWDKGLLSVELGHVEIRANSIIDAWQQMTKKYLVRANLYMDTLASPQVPITLDKDKITAKELLDAILHEYPAFTYSQNPATGIIWIHPKQTAYGDILPQPVRVDHSLNGVPMYTDVYVPLCKLLAPDFVDSSELWASQRQVDSWLYDVTVAAGTYSGREILDYCCLANPTKAFLILWPSQKGSRAILLANLLYPSPITLPRAEAERFWEIEVGKSTNGIPKHKEIREAMSSDDPEKRFAASLYFEACENNYTTQVMIDKADNSEQAIWTALGVQYAVWRDSDTNFFSRMMRYFPRVNKDLRQIKDPILALLVSLQLTREKQDTSYVDNIFDKHRFTQEEIDKIKPEIIRMARTSSAVRERLNAMDLGLPEFSTNALRDLQDKSSLSLVLPVAK